jgi:hypothetical protein
MHVCVGFGSGGTKQLGVKAAMRSMMLAVANRSGAGRGGLTVVVDRDVFTV